MTAAESWPVRIAALGPVAVGTALWRAQGQLCVTLMLKGTFELVPEGPMRLVDPEPLCTIDRHLQDSPNRSLRVAAETALQRSMAEVVVLGEALAPPGSDGKGRAQRSSIRLAVWSSTSRLIDKTISVLGNRTAAGAEPEPFERIWHGWERCLGGVGCADNPLGVGLGASTDQLPNFVDPTEPDKKVTCLAPVPATFPARRKLLGSTQRKQIEAARIAEVGDEFGWEYFQCASPDQRTRHLQGGEWFELDGMTEEGRLRTALPPHRALARNYGVRQPLVPDWIPLVADFVQIHADRRRCTVVWRGGFPVESEQAAADLLIGAGLALEGQPVSWPDSTGDVEQRAGPAADASSPAVTAAQSAGLDLAQRAEQAALAGETVAIDVDAATPHRELPWETSKATPPKAANPVEQAGVGLPFRRREAPSARPPGDAENPPTFEGPSSASGPGAASEPDARDDAPRKPGSSPLEGTAVLTAADIARLGVDIPAPFDIAEPVREPAAPNEKADPISVPGAPWSKQRLEPIPPSRGETTITLAKPPAVPAPLADSAEAKPAPVPGAAQSAPSDGGADADARAREQELARRKQQEEEARSKQQEEEARRKQQEEEAERLRAEAEALREAEAKRFAEEQAAARAEAEQRAAEEAQRRKKAAAALRTGMYDAFKRKR